ncbi:hypothetical protein ISCGN_013266 [Ixodes scapularis]
MNTAGMRSLLGGHGVGGVARTPFSRCNGVVVVCVQWLASCFDLVLCRSQVPPSCMKVSLNPKQKKDAENNYDYMCPQYKGVALQALTTSMPSLLCCRGKFKG